MKWYKQPDSMDCGPTCLRMVAKYYKKDLSLQYLRDKTQIGREGVSLLGISEAAETIGFRTRAVKISFSQLIEEVKLPAILHWNQNHFVVAVPRKKTEKKITVADPAKGVVSYTKTEFLRHWANVKADGVELGVALLLEPMPEFYKQSTGGEEKRGIQFKHIISYVTPYKKLVAQLFIGLGVATFLQLVLPFLTQSIVDVGINSGNLHFIYIVLLAQLALFTGRLVIEFVRSWILLHISTRINISILTDFLIKLMKLPVSFFDSKKTGDVMQRMRDHTRIESFLTGSSLNVLFSLINLIIFSFVLIIFNLNSFVVFVIASFIYAVWVVLFLKRRKELDYQKFEILSQEQSATIQLIQGMQEIKLNGAEQQFRWNWERIQVKLFRFKMMGLSLNQWQQSGAFFINESKNIIITFFSAKAVIDGKMTLGSMLAIQYILGQLNSPIEQIIGFVQNWQNAKISMDRLNEIHSIDDEESETKQLLKELPIAFRRKIAGGIRKSSNDNQDEGSLESYENTLTSNSEIISSEHRESNNGEPAIRNSGVNEKETDISDCSKIEFKNVSFTYPSAGNEPVLKNISFELKKGKTTAIVGMSGSGKTTLLKLLLKFYEPQKGNITLVSALPPNVTSLATISHKTWRSYCGVVMQDSFIFSDTIANNIAVGVDSINRDRLVYAVTVANVFDFIESLPLGFDTKIGAEGIGVSMGQKQRILIARAVYRNPEFIFLDEATNSLDANNESIIVNNLQSFLKNRTVVVVAHRLSTVKNADQIIVLNGGSITERGTHHELVSLKGEYYTLVKNQLELGH